MGRAWGQGDILDNESGKIDIKDDSFFTGPYRQERMLAFDVEKHIEQLEAKEELTVGDRTSKQPMCMWCGAPRHIRRHTDTDIEFRTRTRAQTRTRKRRLQ